MNSLMAKIGLISIALVSFYSWLHLWHYAPMEEMEKGKETIKEKDRNISILQNKVKVKPFESKYKGIKEAISTPKKERPHEEINLTIGIHTTIFD